VPSDEAPQWVRDAELSYPLPADRDFAEVIKERGLVPPDVVLDGGPTAQALHDRYHEIGTKVLPYITFSNRYLDPDQKDDWPRFRLADRPELCVYNIKSVRERSLFADSVDPRRMEVCSNTEDFCEAMMEEVRHYLEAGADGLFLDHAFGPEKCYGEEFGIHPHLYHDQDLAPYTEQQLRFAPGAAAPNDNALGNFAYAMLLQRAQRLMDTYGPDKAMMLNTTYWPFRYSAQPIRKFVMYAPTHPRLVPDIIWQSGHICMVESHAVVHKYLIAADSDEEIPARWGNFDLWSRLDQTPERYHKAGKRQVALPYFAKARLGEFREDAFYSYATAKLHDMIWMTQLGGPGEEFLKFRLGKPLSDRCMCTDGLYLRAYERGVVAVNSNPKAHRLAIPVPGRRAKDLFEGRDLPVHARDLDVTVPPESGRVYLY
jgi:hypothetical protein